MSRINTPVSPNESIQASQPPKQFSFPTLGVVKWFNALKGFGFITADSPVGDVFLHYSAIKGTGYKSVMEGQRVSFEMVTGPRGPMAVDCEVL